MDPVEKMDRPRENRSLREWLARRRIIRVTSGCASYVSDPERFAGLENVRTAIKETSERFPETADTAADRRTR